MILLVRVDPKKNASRWYSVIVQPTLMDGCTVVCLWGSRGTSYQRERILPVSSPDEAQALAEQIVARKLRRGYVHLPEDESTL